MKQIVIQLPKPRSEAARMLADNRYHHRVVLNKKRYSRKGKNSSKKLGDESSRTLFSSGIFRELTEIVLLQIAHGNAQPVPGTDSSS